MPKSSRLLQEGMKQLNTEIQIRRTATSWVSLCLISVYACWIAYSAETGGPSTLVHPRVFNGKTRFRDLTLQILKLTNKMFPISCKVTLNLFFFVLFKAEKTVSKLTLHHMGKLFNIRFGKVRFGIWRVTLLKNLLGFFFTTWKLWDGLVVSVQWTIYRVRIEMIQSLLSLNMCWNF